MNQPNTPSDDIGRVEPKIAIDDLAVRYPGRRESALDGASVAVDAGTILGIAGRTGAGKSTLALAAAGFIPRVVRARIEGRIVVAGIDLANASAGDVLGRVGIVFATPANQLSASKLTVREELAFGLENLGVPRADMDDRIDATLSRLGIDHLADREPFALSGGEQQRVAIASIVAMGTDVLVLDEPTAQLDPFGTVLVGGLLRELARSGTTILVVEHDPAILAGATKVAVLEAGRVVAAGVPGAALGNDALAATGMSSPTIVALGAIAGVPAEQRFDEAVVADALAALGPAERSRLALPAPTAPGGLHAEEAAAAPWLAVRDQPPTAVEIETLTHRYSGGDADAVRDVSITIEAGQPVVIVGQNGSGKTTLAKHLNGLLRPTSGRVLVGGADIRAQPIYRIAGKVGFVFQNPDDQLFERSVEREVSFGPRNIKLPPESIRQLVDAALEAVGLDDVRTTNPYDLDLSRRKLVALASVLALDPAVVVLDEPTTGQDGPGVRRVGTVIERLRGAGRTVIAISHDMEFAAEHFARVIVMARGSVILDGTPAEVFAAEQTELLATAGVAPPVAARIGARLGLVSPTPAALLAALGARPP
jgi:energy-coupling factor transport system ATP-binding protein